MTWRLAAETDFARALPRLDIPRFTICVALGLEAAFWLYLAGTGVADNLDFARGMGHWVAIAATAALVLLAFPALTLAVCNLRMRLAAILTAVVALLYAYPFVASLPKFSNGTLGLWALLAAVLIGCGAIWNRPRADEAPSEPLSNAQVQHRITFPVRCRTADTDLARLLHPGGQGLGHRPCRRL